MQVKSLTDIKNENAVNIQHCDAKGGVGTVDVISVQTLKFYWLSGEIYLDMYHLCFILAVCLAFVITFGVRYLLIVY